MRDVVSVIGCFGRLTVVHVGDPGELPSHFSEAVDRQIMELGPVAGLNVRMSSRSRDALLAPIFGNGFRGARRCDVTVYGLPVVVDESVPEGCWMFSLRGGPVPAA